MDLFFSFDTDEYRFRKDNSESEFHLLTDNGEFGLKLSLGVRLLNSTNFSRRQKKPPVGEARPFEAVLISFVSYDSIPDLEASVELPKNDF